LLECFHKTQAGRDIGPQTDRTREDRPGQDSSYAASSGWDETKDFQGRTE